MGSNKEEEFVVKIFVPAAKQRQQARDEIEEELQAYYDEIDEGEWVDTRTSGKDSRKT